MILTRKNKMTKPLNMIAASVVIGSLALVTFACKQKAGVSKLRNTSYPAPFSATLSTTQSGWAVGLGDSGIHPDFTVTEVSYVSSSAAATGVFDSTQGGGVSMFTASVNYTFQFAVKRNTGTATPVLCETSFAAPLRYTIESTFIKCSGDLLNEGNSGGGTQLQNESEDAADQAMGLAVINNNLSITEAMARLNYGGPTLSTKSIARWNSLESQIKGIVARYPGYAAGATEEVISAIQGSVQVTNSVDMASALIKVYGATGGSGSGNSTNNSGDPNFVDPPAPPNTEKKCVCEAEDIATNVESVDPKYSTVPNGQSCSSLDGQVLPDSSSDYGWRLKNCS